MRIKNIEVELRYFLFKYPGNPVQCDITDVGIWYSQQGNFESHLTEPVFLSFNTMSCRRDARNFP